MCYYLLLLAIMFITYLRSYDYDAKSFFRLISSTTGSSDSFVLKNKYIIFIILKNMKINLDIVKNVTYKHTTKLIVF
jgi:hypothetical protein